MELGQVKMRVRAFWISDCEGGLEEASRGSQSPFSRGIIGSYAKDRIHEFDVSCYFNILLHCESPCTPKSRLGEFNRDMDSEQILLLYSYLLFLFSNSEGVCRNSQDGDEGL